MRRLAIQAMAKRISSNPALLFSGFGLLAVSLWRATAMLLSDISADWAEEALDGFAGKLAHWVVLVMVMLAYAIHALSAKQQDGRTCRRPARATRLPRHHRPMRPPRQLRQRQNYGASLRGWRR